MCDNPIQLLIIEDEAVLALDLQMTLQAEGYAVVGVASTGPQALALFSSQAVDLVLCDIRLQGPWDGIETITRMQAIRPVPVIYLTALTDQPTLDRALPTAPSGYLPKPVTRDSLRTAIALALYSFAQQQPAADPARPDRDALTRDTILQLNQHVFIKERQQFVRIPLPDVLLLEADNTYTTLVTASRKHALRHSLGNVLERLQAPQLIRIHRSFAVNLTQVESFSDAELMVAGTPVPLGRQYREAFLQRFMFR